MTAFPVAEPAIHILRSLTPATLAVLPGRIRRWVEPAHDERPNNATAVIVDAVRTPGGKRNGKLKNWHPVDLAAEALKAIASRNNLDPALVDDVIMAASPRSASRRSTSGAARSSRPAGPSRYGHDDRPPVRIVPAGAALRRPGRHVRRLRRRRRRWRRSDVARGHGSSIGKDSGWPSSERGGALRAGRRTEEPGHRRRDDRRSVGRLAR